MSQYLLYSTIASQIDDEMANQAPSSDKIVRAVNAEVRNLNTKYDIDSFSKIVSTVMVSDGSVEYKMSEICTDNDIRKIKSVRDDNGNNIPALTGVDYVDFMNDLEGGARKNQFTTYYKNGDLYIRVMTNNYSSVAEDFDVKYLTSNLAIDATGNFYEEVSSGGGLYVLLPDEYLDLICLGAEKRLFYQSIGESDATQVALVRNRYESELKKLGLSDNASMLERKTKKVKMHKQW